MALGLDCSTMILRETYPMGTVLVLVRGHDRDRVMPCWWAQAYIETATRGQVAVVDLGGHLSNSRLTNMNQACA
jgi:hypothetical protein